MLLRRKAEVTVGTSQFIMDRGPKGLFMYLKGLSASVFKGERKSILVAAETGISRFLYGLYGMGAVTVDADCLFELVHHP